MIISHCRLTKNIQKRLLEYFVLEVTARSAANILGIHPNSAIANIIKQFDVVAVQEIRDKEGLAIIKLLGEVNSTNDDYSIIVSPRVGRTSSKEQYAIFYRKSNLQIEKDGTLWPDTQDLFEREPYMVMLKAINGTFDFVLVDIHTKPDDSAKEIAFLPEVIRFAAEYYEEPDVLCIGDLNADGAYFDEDSYQTIFPYSSYLWIIPNSADTTVGKQSNTYDRISATSTIQEDWTGEWGVYRFDEAEAFSSLGIDAASLTDHYPVWASFYIDRDSK